MLKSQRTFSHQFQQGMRHQRLFDILHGLDAQLTSPQVRAVSLALSHEN